MHRQVGETYEFENGHFTVEQDLILKQKDVLPFMRKMLLGMFLFMVVFGMITVFIFRGNVSFEINVYVFLFYFVGYIVFIIVHELLHGISFILFSKNSWKTMKFGLVIKSGVAYCISSIPVSVPRTKVSLMMPIYAVCLPLFIVGIVTHDFLLTIYSILLASGSVGDFYYMWKLRDVPKSKYIMEEMPTKKGYEIGFLVLNKEEVR